MFKDHEFFQDLEINNGEEAVIKCFKAMKYVFHNKGDCIFKYGDEGYYFYIILKGKVAVKILLPVEKEFDQDELQEYLLKYYDDISWD